MPVRERASTRVWKGGREAVVIGAGGGSREAEGLEGGEGGERRGQRRAAFGADVVPTATKRGKGGGVSRPARSAADGAEVMIAAVSPLVCVWGGFRPVRGMCTLAWKRGAGGV